jgi:protein SCO1/2
MTKFYPRILALLALLALPLQASTASAPAPFKADTTSPTADSTTFMGNKPEEITNVGIDEKPNALLPMDLEFIDATGQKVRLGDYFKDRKTPVILNLGYYDCPMLCGLVARGMIGTLEDLDLSIYKDFDVLTVSIDPRETYLQAAAKKDSFIEEYRSAATDPNANPRAGWHFLVGDKAPIQALTEAVGFRYQFIPSKGEYSHAAALIIITPEGRVSRYLYGIKFPQKTLRLSLVEAAEGKIGSIGDQILLYCFQFDHTAGKYSFHAMNIMRAGAVLTVCVLAGCILYMLKRERHPPLPNIN